MVFDTFDDVIERVADIDHFHLRARHHDLANDHFRGGEGAFGDAQGVGVEELTLVCRVQQLHQLFAVFRFAHQERRKTFKETGFATWAATVHTDLLRNEASAAPGDGGSLDSWHSSPGAADASHLHGVRVRIAQSMQDSAFPTFHFGSLPCARFVVVALQVQQACTIRCA